MRSLFIVAVLGTVCVVGCSQNTSPTLPTSAPSATRSSVTAQTLDTATSSITTENVAGNGASANFTTVNGCVANSVTVTVGTQVTTTSGGSTSATLADLTIASIDTCSGQSLGTATGSSGNLSFAGDVNSATLSGGIVIVESSGATRLVPVSLTWTGTGTITKSNTTTKIVTGTVTTTIHIKDASRPATVSGTVDNLVAVGASAMLFTQATVTKTH